MFISLLAATFAVAFVVSWILVVIFRKPMSRILNRILDDKISYDWVRYLIFAVFVVGISSGVRPRELQQYISPESADMPPLILDTDRWVLEIYRTIIGTLEGVAWMLLVFFIVSLIVFAVVRMMELRKPAGTAE